MNLADPHDRVAAAGEYVLGTLAGEERLRFEAALADDAALQEEVYRWQDRLLALAGRVAPVRPDDSLWQGIEARLAVSGAEPAATGAGPAATGAVAGPADAGRSNVVSLAERRLRRWQTVAGLLMAACVVLAVLVVMRAGLPGSGPPERYLTVLQAQDRSAGWVIEVTVGGKLRLVPVAPAMQVPEGKALQFWTKLDSDPGPTSLGLVTPGQVTELPLDRLPGVAANQLFELTLEPATGSPIGRPTGPIVYIGRSVRL